MQIETNYTAEIELRVSATFIPGAPDTGPSYSSGGEPGWDAYVEDVTIEGLAFERVVSKAVRVEGANGYTTHREIQVVDLAKGVDMKNPEVQKLLANLVEALGRDLEGDLLASEEGGRP